MDENATPPQAAPPPPAPPPQSSTHEQSAKQPDNRTAMGVLSYLSVLVLIPYLSAKDDPFVAFHIRQGLVLLGIEIVVMIGSSLFWFLWPLWQAVNIVVLVLIIIGIVRVVHGEQKALPLVGHLAGHINI